MVKKSLIPLACYVDVYGSMDIEHEAQFKNRIREKQSRDDDRDEFVIAECKYNVFSTI